MILGHWMTCWKAARKLGGGNTPLHDICRGERWWHLNFQQFSKHFVWFHPRTTHTWQLTTIRTKGCNLCVIVCNIYSRAFLVNWLFNTWQNPAPLGMPQTNILIYYRNLGCFSGAWFVPYNYHDRRCLAVPPGEFWATDINNWDAQPPSACSFWARCLHSDAWVGQAWTIMFGMLAWGT